MRWYNNLYIGKLASKRKRTIIRKIKNGKIQIGVYVLSLPMNDDNVLDIYPSYILNQKYYRTSDICIVGIAFGYDEAVELLQIILMDCYKRTGQFKIRNMTENDSFK